MVQSLLAVCKHQHLLLILTEDVSQNKPDQHIRCVICYSDSLSAFISTLFFLFQSEGKLEQREFHIVCHILVISCLTHCSFKPVINQPEFYSFLGSVGCVRHVKTLTDSWYQGNNLTRLQLASWHCPAYFVCMSDFSEYPSSTISCVICSLTFLMIWNFVSK